jgi:hypothetical protein
MTFELHWPTELDIVIDAHEIEASASAAWPWLRRWWEPSGRRPSARNMPKMR